MQGLNDELGKRIIETLTEKLGQAGSWSGDLKNGLPKPLTQFNQEIESWVKDAVSGALSKLDLVTHEEFDVQAAVLQRTRERLEETEKRLADLEAKLNIDN